MENFQDPNTQQIEWQSELTSKILPVSPSMVSSMGRTWILVPYLMSGHACTDMTSPMRTRRLFRTCEENLFVIVCLYQCIILEMLLHIFRTSLAIQHMEQLESGVIQVKFI